MEGGRPLRLQAAPARSEELRGRRVGNSEGRRQSKGVGVWGQAGRRGRTSGGGGAEWRGGSTGAGALGRRDRPRGRERAPAMGSVARLAAVLAVLALRAGDPVGAAARGDTFSALTSVARALAPERRLLGLLRRYLRGEEARLRDLTR